LLVILAITLRASNVGAQQVRPERTLAPLGSGFTYQGELQTDEGPVTDLCDFQFNLWDTATFGAQVGDTQTINNVSVEVGQFSVVT
jgi:hypothetical protein